MVKIVTHIPNLPFEQRKINNLFKIDTLVTLLCEIGKHIESDKITNDQVNEIKFALKFAINRFQEVLKIINI